MNESLILIMQSIYILIPAYFANMAPPVLKKFKIMELLNKPVDGGKKFSDKEYLFGKNKTYRGFAGGIFFAIIGAYIQMMLFSLDFFKSISIPGIDYSSHIIVISLGLLLGLGALTGDLVESFIKRRLGIKSGKRFIPWDQVDHIIGAYIFALPIAYNFISIEILFYSLITGFVLHVLVNHISYYAKIRKEKW